MEQKLSYAKVNKKRFLREMIFRGLYAVELGCEANETLLNMIAKDNAQRIQKQIAFDEAEQNAVINKICDIISKKPEIDKVIEEFLVGWKMDRISIVDLCILRMSVFDLFYNKGVPANVVISEAVLLAEVFSDEKQKKFINGVLGAVLKEMNKNSNDCESLIIK